MLQTESTRHRVRVSYLSTFVIVPHCSCTMFMTWLKSSTHQLCKISRSPSLFTSRNRHTFRACFISTSIVSFEVSVHLAFRISRPQQAVAVVAAICQLGCCFGRQVFASSVSLPSLVAAARRDVRALALRQGFAAKRCPRQSCR